MDPAIQYKQRATGAFHKTSRKKGTIRRAVSILCRFDTVVPTLGDSGRKLVRQASEAAAIGNTCHGSDSANVRTHGIKKEDIVAPCVINNEYIPIKIGICNSAIVNMAIGFTPYFSYIFLVSIIKSAGLSL